MTLANVDIRPYEGLIFSTARRYAPILQPDYEEEDIQQVLRVKVWQAVRAYDPERATQRVEKFVFSCVTNRVKDLLKEVSRRNDKRQGSMLFIEDVRGLSSDGFEQRYLIEHADDAFARVDDEDVRLPSTLTELEVKVVRLLVLDFTQTEIAEILDTSRSRVRTAHTSVKEKMADWSPTVPELPVAA